MHRALFLSSRPNISLEIALQSDLKQKAARSMSSTTCQTTLFLLLPDAAKTSGFTVRPRDDREMLI